MLPTTPQTLAARLTRAKQLIARGKAEEARADLARLSAQVPGSADAAYLLSQAAFEAGDVPAALDALDRALRAAPGSAALWFAAAQLHDKLGRIAPALAAYDTAARLAPKDLRYRVEKARYLQTLGRFDEAEAQFRRLLKRHPDNTGIYRIFLATKRLKKGDPLIRAMLRLWTHPRLNDSGRMDLGFTLARAMEETGETDKVFGFLNTANAAQRARAPYDRAAREAEWQATLAAQDGAELTPVGPEMALRPVFVTGMPRSGTTLVEQILARHSAVAAGGELGHALRLAAQRFGQAAAMTPLGQIAPEALAGWAAQYQRLAARDSGEESGVVTDKSIQSHMILGLIHRGMPGARMVIVHRDPRDVALSIYKNPFALGTHRYANALDDIADEIKRFRRSVAFWRDRLPEGTLYEVHYEDLVADPEPVARALMAHAGLEWEPACLSSQATGGTVRTLSLAQVRQPIHAGRRAAWRAFETDLQPFIDAWGDAPWD